jgi:hypothetical protein
MSAMLTPAYGFDSDIDPDPDFDSSNQPQPTRQRSGLSTRAVRVGR